MRVAMISTWDDLCGISSYSHKLVSALEPHCEVRVLPIDKEKRSTGIKYIKELAREANTSDIVHIQHEYSFFGGGTLPRYLYRALPRSIKKATGSSLFFDLARRLNKPYVATVHEIIDEHKATFDQVTKYEFIRNRLNRFGNKLAFSKPAQIVTHSQNRKDVLIGMGVPDDKINVIPIGIDSPTAPGDFIEFRQKYGITGSRVLAIFGFVNWRKGHANAIRMLSALQNTDVTLVIAGAVHPNDMSGYLDEIRSLVDELQLQDRVVFTGELNEEEIATLHGVTDITLALYNDMGGNSSSITTSISYQVPIVAWDLVHIHQMNNSFNCIDILPYGDTLAAAKRVDQLLSNRDSYEDLHRRTQYASSAYGRDKEAFLTYQLYAKCLTTP